MKTNPCHGKYNLGTSVIERYDESFHGKKYALGHPNAPTCVTCHNSHAIKKWDDPASPVAWENRTANMRQMSSRRNQKICCRHYA